MIQERFVTEEGMQKLKDELDHLKNKKRKEVSERIRTAAAFGDLSENFEYASAKEEQEMVERRIREIEETILSSKVVSTVTTGDKVQIGSRVTIEAGGEKVEYTITGPQEADPLSGKISAESPLGRALVGKKKGDKAKVETPGGKVEYRILEIS